MTCDYEIDRGRGLALINCRKVDFGEVGQVLAGICQRPELSGIGRLLVDLTHADCHEVTYDTIEKNGLAVVAVLQGNRIRTAIVAPDDLAFGLSRVFAAYAGDERLGIFREMNQARAWLELDR
jgi:hypothetical protein